MRHLPTASITQHVPTSTAMSLCLLTVLISQPLGFAQSAKQHKASPSKTTVASFDSLLTQADTAISQGNFIKALTVSESAMQLRPSDDRGYYYASFALLKRGVYDRAATLATTGREHAPEERQDSFARLIKAIQSSRDADEQIQIGDRAATDGSAQQAADAYASAYKINPSNEAIGVKAAKLYLIQLSQPDKAIELLKGLQLRTNDQSAYPEISDLLARAEADKKQRMRAQRLAELRKEKDTFRTAIQELRVRQRRELEAAAQNDEEVQTFVNKANNVDSGFAGVDDINRRHFRELASQYEDKANENRNNAETYKQSIEDLTEKIKDVDSEIASLQRG